MEGTILLVDDEESNLKLLETMLLPQGYKVLTANNGKSALDLLKTEDAQVVLLDIMMPGMTGFEVLKLIRENKELGALPVIVLTSLGDKENRIKGLQLGADDYISKPFNLEELRAKINSQFDLYHLRKQLNGKGSLLKVINRIGEGVVIADNNFVPVIISVKAKDMLGIKELPENIFNYLSGKYNDDIAAGTVRTSYVFKQNEAYLSLTIDPVKDGAEEIDSYIIIIKNII